MDVGCIVLAGGKGLRLGRDKASETVDTKSLLERVVSCLSFFDGNVLVVTATKRLFPQLNSHPESRIVTDIYPGKGSLGGIYTGLVASTAFYNLVVACDMPFLNRNLLSYMVQVSPDYDLVVPRLGDMVEPLHAIYSRNCLAVIEELIKHNKLEVRRLLNLVRVRYVDAGEIDKFDPGHLSFFNINTNSDLERARGLVREDIISDKR